MAFHAPKEPFNADSFRECSFYINYLSQALNERIYDRKNEETIDVAGRTRGQ